MIKLPPIQYLFGNTDLNNWITNCKPFKPRKKSIKTEEIKFISIELGDKLTSYLEAQEKAYKELIKKHFL